MHTVYRLYAVLFLLVTALASTVAQAAVTTFTDRAAWQAAAGGIVTTIDFATKDDGSPITNPVSDILFSSLTLRGVTFPNIRSYFNDSIYTPLAVGIHASLPPNTTAIGVDLTSFFDIPGDTYTITISSGGVSQVFNSPAGTNPGNYDFFGLISTSPVEWIEYHLDFSAIAMDNFSFVALTALQVRIDIKPSASNDINPVNPDANGVIPVSLLSSSTFDATQVYIPSLRFGRAGTEAPIVTHSYQDTNGDGRLDLVMQFRTQSTGIQCGDTTAKLTGQTVGGAQITGSDVIRTVGCK
jgi:hypothetical protein